jgi:hypothetical protein
MFQANKQIFKTSTKALLETVNQLHVLEYYLSQPIVLNENIKSPIRHDPNPGCRFCIDADSNVILFDYSRGTSHNIVSVVAEKIGIDYMEALAEIQKTFVVKNTNYVKPEKLIAPDRVPFKIFIKRKEIQERDLKFWSIGNVEFTKKDFDFYNIISLEVYSINDMVFRPSQAYLFNFPSFRQIYRPDLRKDARGLEARYRSDTMLGLHVIGKITNFDYIFVNKSCRDGIFLHKLGFNSAFVLKEGHKYLPEQIEYLQQFKKVILLYDPDETGVANSTKWCEQLGWSPFFYLEAKDTVEMLENFPKEYVEQILNNKLNEKIV